MNIFKNMIQGHKGKIVEVGNPFSNYYFLKVKVANNFEWMPGQFILLGIKGGGIKPFSIASIKEEGYVLFGTRSKKEMSKFKNALITDSIGRVISLRGPFGGFNFSSSIKRINLIAGGIGITPIRSIANSFVSDENVEVNIVYSSRYYLFEEDLIQFSQKNPNINLFKTRNIKDTQLELNKLVLNGSENDLYLICGSNNFVSLTKKILKQSGISGKNIKTDSFLGYK